MTVEEFIFDNNISEKTTIRLFNSYIDDYEAIGSAHSEEVLGFGYCRVKGVKQDNPDSFMLFI